MKVYLDSRIRIPLTSLPVKILEVIKEECTHSNSQFFKEKGMGIRPTCDPYIHTYATNDEYLILPRGILPKIISIFKEAGITYKILDARSSSPMNAGSFKIKEDVKIPLKFQMNAVKLLADCNQRILLAPTGSGKTIIGLDLIDALQQKTMIIVHTTLLFKQWQDEIKKYSHINFEIGELGTGNFNLAPITMAMIQTLYRLTPTEYKTLNLYFGSIIIDECHRVPANETFKVVNRLKSKYRFGLTGTYKRKDGKEFLLFDAISHNVIEITPEDLAAENRYVPLDVEFIKTEFEKPYIRPSRNTYLTWKPLMDALIADENRNAFICKEIVRNCKQGYICLVAVERLIHADDLCARLSNSLGEDKVAIMTSNTKEDQRIKIKERIMTKDLKVLIATRGLICEGADIPALSCLHITMPYNNRLLTEQLVGRLRRIAEDKLPPIVKDYVDLDAIELKNSAIKRRGFYRKLKFKIIGEEVLN